MGKTRICFVGGGSYQWTPKLLTDIALTKDLSGTIVLHDIAPGRWRRCSGSGARSWRRPALTSASRRAAICTRRCGCRVRDRHDHHWRPGGDAQGSGYPAALRHLPVGRGHRRAGRLVAGVAERPGHGRDRQDDGAGCPNAWMLNLTNPLTVLTRAVYKTTSIKAMGLCHELQGVGAA